MIVRKVLDPKVVWRIAKKRVLTLLVLSTTVYVLYEEFGNKDIAISTIPASILGVALAFLIGFRVNSAYERWWEGRKIWGNIINDSRSFSRQVLTFIGAPHQSGNSDAAIVALKKSLVYGQIGFAYAYKNHLRKLDLSDEIKPYFNNETFEKLRLARHLPNAILLLQSSRIQEALNVGHTEDFRHMQLDNSLNRICEAMGAGERIKNTIFPRQYSFYSTLFTHIYSLMIPFILVHECGWTVIPFTVIIGFIFYALDSIASGIENPFENTYNDVPLSSICRTIEINLREMLDEKDLPKPLEPVNGFLY